MRNKVKSLVWILAPLGLFFWGPTCPAKAKIVDEIEVVVDQDSMTRVEVQEAIDDYFLMQRMNPAKPGSAEYETAKKAVVDGFVKEVLLAEEADREKVEVQDGEVDHEVNQEIENMKKRFATEQEFTDGLKKEGITLDDLKSDIHDKLLRRLKANRVLHLKQMDLPALTQVSEEEVQKYYDQHPNDYEQVKFSMILFRVAAKSKPGYVKQVQTQALGLVKELKGGADFAAYANKYSEDQGSAANGGEVGMMARSDIADPKLAKGVFALPVKGIGLVRGEEGYYIVKVSYKGKADYASVAPEIKEHLRKQKQDNGLDHWVNSLRKDAYIVVDGEVVPYTEPADASAGTNTTTASAAAPGGKTAPSGTTLATTTATGSTTVTGTPASEKSGLYPTLSPVGSLVFSFGGEGFSYGSEDLAGYYGSKVQTAQNFPFGFGLNLGLDWTLDPSVLIGLKAEVIRKTTETITDASNYTEQWSASAIAPEVSVKLLVPLDEGTNFVLSADGGFYNLLGSAVTVSGPSIAENADLGGSAWGGDLGGSLEFFFDDSKNSSFSLDVGYRLVKFNNISTHVNTNNSPVTFGNPLMNLSSPTPASIDFSGVKMGLSVRFYLDKDND